MLQLLRNCGCERICTKLARAARHPGGHVGIVRKLNATHRRKRTGMKGRSCGKEGDEEACYFLVERAQKGDSPARLLLLAKIGSSPTTKLPVSNSQVHLT